MTSKQSQSGFTMIEVLFALAIFAIVLAGMPNFFLAQLQLSSRSQIRTEAISVAKQELDVLRLTNPATMPTSGSVGPTTISLHDRNYEVTTYYCENATYCASNTSRHIRVEVTYGGESIYDVQTVYTKLQ
ncbi:MAG: type II secretion system protein [Bdellovibrionales bacterium]|nr:type II secretion system protein [Bdellovibrionales bacterium]